MLSFFYESVFDFFHYWAHRSLHENNSLFKVIHLQHHRHTNPTCYSTFDESILDVIITNSIPQLVTLMIINVLRQSLSLSSLSLLEFAILTSYKTFIEVSGHCGKQIKNSSFVQFKWLPKWCSIELYVEDHHKHHISGNCNYGKRLNLWDKIFGTFKDDLSRSKRR